MDKKQLIIIHTYKQPANMMLAMWLQHQNIKWVYSEGAYAIDVGKNRSIKQFLLTDYDRLIMIANDMVPNELTDNILTVDYPITYCQNVGAGAHISHHGDNDFSGACWAADRAVLEKMDRPWFKMVYNQENTEQISCDCSYFRENFKKHGLTSKQVGEIGHIQQAALYPGEQLGEWKAKWI